MTGEDQCPSARGSLTTGAVKLRSALKQCVVTQQIKNGDEELLLTILQRGRAH